MGEMQFLRSNPPHHFGAGYLPQVGDIVVYLIQGHELHVRKFTQSDGSFPPWRNTNKFPLAECLVLDFTYHRPARPSQGAGIFLRIRLQVQASEKFNDASNQGGPVVGATFSAAFHVSGGLPEFLVLRSRLRQAVARKWRVGERFRMFFKREESDAGSAAPGASVAAEEEADDSGQYFPGTIKGHSAADTAFPTSPWECLQVQWDADDSDDSDDENAAAASSGNSINRVSPWEVEDARPKSAVTTRIPCGCQGSVWTKEEVNTILSILGSVRTQVDAGTVSASVRRVEDPFVPTGLNFNLIRQRVTNSYYRSPEALQHDLRLASTKLGAYIPGSRQSVLDAIREAVPKTGQDVVAVQCKCSSETPVAVPQKRQQPVARGPGSEQPSRTKKARYSEDEEEDNDDDDEDYA